MFKLNPVTCFSAAALLLGSGAAIADDFDLIGGSQEDFSDVAEDITAALNYKALGPAEGDGLLGFSIGAFGSYVPVKNDEAWQNLTGEDIGEIGMVGINATKGLPFGLDVGAFYTEIPGAGANLFGAELRYSIWDGGVASPALAIRGTYTQLSGVEDVDYESVGIDLSISKGFVFLTPYGGVGMVFGSLEETADEVDFAKEDVDATRIFAGLRMSLGFMSLTPEYERIGDNDAFNLRVSIGL